MMSLASRSWRCPTCLPTSLWEQQLKARSHRARPYSTVLQPDRAKRDFRMAVIGSGPAGFYTVYRIMSKLQHAKVDMFEALPVPFGLVRFGVAPDHPEVKNCQDKFEKVATSANFTFVGNVSVGEASYRSDGCTVSLSSLMHHYDAVLFAYGAAQDKKLGIPGESTLKGIYSARQFVAWYNGLPEFANLSPDLSGDEAVIIGQGNVALDVARMLVTPIDSLRRTDIVPRALEQLSKSRIKRVHVVGRRGLMQAAFTIKELRELMKLPDVAFHTFDKSLVPQNLKSLDRPIRRLAQLALAGSNAPFPGKKSWSLDFCLSPLQFLPSDGDISNVGATEFTKTELSSPLERSARVVGLTGHTTRIKSDVVFRSIGYKSLPLSGFEELNIPFNDRIGVIGNDGFGRVWKKGSEISSPVSETFPGLYCSGWVKRGPVGVIASTMDDAFTTADAIVQDWLGNAKFLADSPDGSDSQGWDAVHHEVHSAVARPVSWSDWRKIDAAERKKGLARDAPREKFTSTEAMLATVQ